MFANRSLTADLLVPDLVGRCKANPLVTVDAEDVDLSKACIVLDGWDRRFDLASRGAALFREWLGHYANPGRGFLTANGSSSRRPSPVSRRDSIFRTWSGAGGRQSRPRV